VATPAAGHDLCTRRQRRGEAVGPGKKAARRHTSGEPNRVGRPGVLPAPPAGNDGASGPVPPAGPRRRGGRGGDSAAVSGPTARGWGGAETRAHAPAGRRTPRGVQGGPPPRRAATGRRPAPRADARCRDGAWAAAGFRPRRHAGAVCVGGGPACSGGGVAVVLCARRSRRGGPWKN